MSNLNQRGFSDLPPFFFHYNTPFGGGRLGGDKDSLSKYPELKERMQSLLQNSEKITPKQWKAEIQSLQSDYNSIGKEQTKTAIELAYVEIISYNKKNLERELQNESRQQNRQQSRTKRREEEI